MDLRKIRADFPIINEKTMDGRRLVYLDSACQSLRPKQVTEAVSGYYHDLGGCTGTLSQSNALAARTGMLVSEARAKVVRFIGAEETEVVWQPNTTYGMNLVAMSLSSPFCPPGIRLERGDDVVTTDAEHHSGLLPFWRLEQEKGARHRIFQVEADGIVDLQRFQEFLTRKTKLVSIVWASNVTGVINPVGELVKIAHDNGSLVLVDGAQYVPHRPVDVGGFEMDFLAFSIHKMCGSSGMGVLYGTRELLKEMPAVIVGGETVSGVSIAEGREDRMVSPIFRAPPERFEPGLQNFAGIIGAGAAVDYLSDVGMESIELHEEALTRYLMSEMGGIPGMELVGPADYEPARRSALASFRLKDGRGNLVEAERVSQWMDGNLAGHKVLIRSGGHEAHPLVHRLGIPELSVSRASLYLYNDKDDIDLFTGGLVGLSKSLR